MNRISNIQDNVLFPYLQPPIDLVNIDMIDQFSIALTASVSQITASVFGVQSLQLLLCLQTHLFAKSTILIYAMSKNL